MSGLLVRYLGTCLLAGTLHGAVLAEDETPGDVLDAFLKSQRESSKQFLKLQQQLLKQMREPRQEGEAPPFPTFNFSASGNFGDEGFSFSFGVGQDPVLDSGTGGEQGADGAGEPAAPGVAGRAARRAPSSEPKK